MTAQGRINRELRLGYGTNPSPGPRRLTKAPSQATLSPGRGLLTLFLCGGNKLRKYGGSAVARQAKINERSGNVIEKKGRSQGLVRPGPLLRSPTKSNRLHRGPVLS
jgi:hypothetical protein